MHVIMEDGNGHINTVRVLYVRFSPNMSGKTIAVFGGTGGTGIAFISQALANGHKVRALVRETSKPLDTHPELTVITGSIFSPESVLETLQSCTHVFITIGPRSIRSETNVCSKSQPIINEAIMKLPKGQIKRIVLVSTAGAGESISEMPFLIKLVVKLLAKQVFSDKGIQEDLVRKLGEEYNCEWTILRPTSLTDKPITKKYQASEKREDVKISFTANIPRADVAQFGLEECVEKDKWTNKIVLLSG